MSDGLILFRDSGVSADRICPDCGSVLTANGVHTGQWVRSFTDDGKQLRPRLYRIWSGIKTRCTNPNSNSYKYYGARGITVCDEWSDYETFRRWCVSNGWKPELQLDRIDNDAGYFPKNCRIATRNQNQQNRRLPSRHRTGKRYARRFLSESDVHMIRDSDISNARLAEMFDVHNATISKIKRRLTWGYLPELSDTLESDQRQGDGSE